MKHYVVDANVPIVANGKSEQANADCVLACIEMLRKIYTAGVTLIDDALLILSEYRRNLSMTGQPGPGDYFMKWLWTVQADQRYCKQVHLHPRETEPDSFDEFPDDERLQSFDPSDRKYVAVALGSGLKPVVVNAVDPDWAEHFTALQETGLRIRFLCPQHVRPEN